MISLEYGDALRVGFEFGWLNGWFEWKKRKWRKPKRANLQWVFIYFAILAERKFNQ